MTLPGVPGSTSGATGRRQRGQCQERQGEAQERPCEQHRSHTYLPESYSRGDGETDEEKENSVSLGPGPRGNPVAPKKKGNPAILRGKGNPNHLGKGNRNPNPSPTGDPVDSDNRPGNSENRTGINNGNPVQSDDSVQAEEAENLNPDVDSDVDETDDLLPADEGADLEGYEATQADELLDSVYGDHAHANDGGDQSITGITNALHAVCDLKARTQNPNDEVTNAGWKTMHAQACARTLFCRTKTT